MKRFFGAIVALAIVLLFAESAFAVPVNSNESESLRALWTSDSNFDAPEGAEIFQIVGNVLPNPEWVENTWADTNNDDEFPFWTIEGASVIRSDQNVLARLGTWRKGKWGIPKVMAIDFLNKGHLPGVRYDISESELKKEIALLSGERGFVFLVGNGWALPFDIKTTPMDKDTFYLVVTTSAEETPETPVIVPVATTETETKQPVPPAGCYFLLEWTGGPTWIMWETSIKVLSSSGTNPSVLLQWEQWSAPPTGEESVVTTTPKPAGAIWPTTSLEAIRVGQQYQMPTTYGGGAIYFYWRQGSACPFPERIAPLLDLKWAPSSQHQQAWAYWDGESTWLWVPVTPPPAGR